MYLKTVKMLQFERKEIVDVRGIPAQEVKTNEWEDFVSVSGSC